MQEIKNRISWDDLNNDIDIIPKWFKEKQEDIPHYDEYKKCFLDGVNCKQYTDQKIVSDVLETHLNALDNNGWVYCNDKMPTPETEVLIVAKRKFRGGEFRYIITFAMYEDGTIRENDSCWRWKILKANGTKRKIVTSYLKDGGRTDTITQMMYITMLLMMK